MRMQFVYARGTETHSLMDYGALLAHSFETERDRDPELTRQAYLAYHVFGFTTYDDSVAEYLEAYAIAVSEAITNQTTFEYIESSVEQYRWYIAMCNMPFFSSKIEWGTSIRGACWKLDITLQSCGLWYGDAQIDRLVFSSDEWNDFIRAMALFSKGVPVS